MAILKVARMGHPVLRRVADAIPVDDIGSEAVQRLIDDLLETVDDQDGAGLAAPQVHASLRIVVLKFDGDTGMRVWINPEITPVSEELAFTFEGCLSVPGVRGMVGRPAEVEVRALDRTGEPVGLRLRGFPAVVAQHEVDHLDGVLYIDRADPRTLAFLEEYRRFMLWPDDEDDEVGDEEGENEEGEENSDVEAEA